MTSKALVWNAEGGRQGSGEHEPPPMDGGGAASGKGQRSPPSSLQNQIPQALYVDEGDGSQAAMAFQSFSESGLAQPGGRRLEDRDLEGEALHRRGDGPIEKLRRHFPKGLILFGKGSRRTAESLTDAGVEVSFEQGDEFVTNAISEEGGVVVRGIRAVREPLHIQMGEHGLASRPQQGPQQFAVPRPHRREPESPAASNQAKQDGFGLIIEGMAEDHGLGVFLPGHAPQKGVPHEAGCFFKTSLAKSFGVWSRLAESQGHFEAIAEFGAKRSIGRRVGSKGMVEMGRDDTKSGLAARPKEGVEQSDRVGSARKGRYQGNA
jgi:hypothetical protein